MHLYECILCQDSHSIPTNGFKLNKKIEQIINQRLHLGENVKQALEILDKFDALLNDAKKMDRDPRGFIYDYVSNVRNVIDLKRETQRLVYNSSIKDMFEKLG